MSHRLYRRLRRYAVFSVVQLLVALVVVGGDLESGYAIVALLIASAPVFWAWGPYQADVAMNPHFQERDRRRWRVLLACLPGSLAVYWYRHIRVGPDSA
jgi:hypothetical protein